MRRATSLPAPGRALIFKGMTGPHGGGDRSTPSGGHSTETMLATVDWAPIGESVAAALVAGLGVTLTFAIGVRGLIRASELRDEGRELAAGAWAAVGAAGLVAALAGVAVGLLLVAADGPLL